MCDSLGQRRSDLLCGSMRDRLWDRLDWLRGRLWDWLGETLSGRLCFRLRDWLCFRLCDRLGKTLRDRLRLRLCDRRSGHRGLRNRRVGLGSGRGTWGGVALAGSAHQVGDDCGGIVGVGAGAGACRGVRRLRA